MGPNHLLIIAPHDVAQLADSVQTHNTNVRKPFVYLSDARATNALIESKYKVIFLGCSDYDAACSEGREILLAEEFIASAIKEFEKKVPVVYLVVPEEFLPSLLQQASYAKDAGKEPFLLLKQYFDTDELNPNFVFQIMLQKTATVKEYEIVPHRHFAPIYRKGIKEKKSEPTGQDAGNQPTRFDVDRAYARLHAGENPVFLEELSVDNLRLLIDRCIDTKRFDLVQCIDKEVARKEQLL